MKKEVEFGVGAGAGSGSISQRHGSGSAPNFHGSPTLASWDGGEGANCRRVWWTGLPRFMSFKSHDGACWLRYCVWGPDCPISQAGERIANTHLVIDGMGNLVQTYDKAHLFDVEIPGKVRLKVSDILNSSRVWFRNVDTLKSKVESRLAKKIVFFGFASRS